MFKNKAFNINLPEELVKEIDSLADKEYRNRSELIREAVRRYLHESSLGRKIHGEAAQLRESGESLQALSLYAQALAAYQRDNDSVGFAEALGDMFLSLRHLYESTNDKKWLILAKHVITAGVEVAEESGEKEALAVPQFNLAKALESLGQVKEAAEVFQKAYDNLVKYPPKNHANRPAIVADFKVHLTTCQYSAGDKGALKRAEEALKELEQAEDISEYNKHVWLSGAHMRMADMLVKDDPKKAKEHLMEAKKIIDADPQLIIRAKQWQKIADKFN